MTTPVRNAESILAQIQRLQMVQPFESVGADARDSYRQAAAVLAVIDNPSRLAPLDTSVTPSALSELIAHDLVPAGPGRPAGSRVLKHDVRRSALRGLGSAARMLTALEANPTERTGQVQRQFEAYLRGVARPLEEQSHSELEASLQALTWLDGIIDGLPSLRDARARVAAMEMAGPFEALAGDDVFRGRVAEMDALRSYVGVLPPNSLRARIQQHLPWGRPDPLAALSVSGPGGVGKSALIARFVLEHLRLPSEARIPFAYLDFERPSLNIAEPITLLDEMLRQLVHQFPEHVAFQKLHADLSRELANVDAEGNRAVGVGRVSVSRSHLAELLGMLESLLGPRPYLIVLDTFEQVQYRGESQAFPFWELLARMQVARPFLRVVISGRAPVTTLLLDDKQPATLALGALDRESAVAFAQAIGIKDSDVAESIVRQVGGVPLSLKLAVELVKRQPEADLAVKSVLWMRATDEVVQGQLFDRLLGQIDNPELRRLAHPGLVLRRLTPETIFYVLREPCQLALRDLDDARALFEQLKQEVSLVSSDEPDGAVVHRHDLRAVMLKLLIQSNPTTATEVSERAVKWYAGQTGKRARAEEAYHRLLLGQRIERSVVSDPDVRASLQTYIAELPLKSQRLLATYGLRVDPQILERATLEERDASIAEQVEQILPHRSAMASALDLLRQRGEPDADSPLWRSWTRVHLERGHTDDALRYVERGLSEAVAANNPERAYQLAAEKAWVAEVGERAPELVSALRLLKRYVDRYEDYPGRLQHGLQLARSQGKFAGQRVDAEWAAATVEWFRRCSPREFFGLLPATVGFWAAVAGTEPAVDLMPIVQLILDTESPFGSITFEDDRSMRALQKAIRGAYAAASIQGKEPNRNHRQFARDLEDLVAAWPYHNLHVHASESHRSYMAP